MKNFKISFIFIGLCLSITSNAGNYEEAMKKSIKSLDTSKTYNSFLEMAGAFQRIANVEKSEWLPLYYSAYSYIQASFVIKDNTVKEVMIVHADSLIEQATKLKPAESEIWALKGLYYIALVSVNPGPRGATYFENVNQALNKSEGLNNNNPRTYLLRGLFVLNTPEAFGGGAKAAMPILKEAMSKFDAYKPENEISPIWGKEYCNQLINQNHQ